ncbi:MAG: TRAP transporter substrate-binding protein, partial [Caulobacterales bacterium]|nr:TRAP transporter substrate-binding protein [Caulobacterales bacterium]
SGGRPLFAADTHPAGYPTVEAVREMARLVHERTDGRLSVKLYPGAQLGEEKDTIEIAVFGGIDLNRVNLAPLNAIAMETVVPALPFLFRSIPHMRAAMDGAPGAAILEALEPHGLVGLCFYDSGARSFYNTRRPIRAPEDLRGLKIRVQNSDLFVAMVEALGGDATPMSFGEVYQGLVQGVVDGAENNWPSFENTRHYEVARHYSLTRHVMAPEVLLASKRRWDTLSEEDRAVIRSAARDSVPVMRGLWDARVSASTEIVTASGVAVIEDVDQAAFAALMEPVWDRFLTTPALRRLAEDILALEVEDA